MIKKHLSFYPKTERPWLTRLYRSSIVGHTTSSNSRIWLRLKTEGSYTFVISKKPLKGQVAGKLIELNDGYESVDWEINPVFFIGAIQFSVIGENDFTHVVDTDDISIVNPLTQDTVYYFAVYNDSTEQWEIGVEKNHSFKTLPEDKPFAWDITFGLYSCHMPFDPKDRSKADASMWSLMKRELDYANAQFVIGAGDQVYCDGTDYLSIWSWLKKVKKDDPSIEDMKSWYQDIYRGYWGFPDLMAVHNQYPNYMIWDDHEIMDGWGSYTRKELSNQLDRWFEWEDVGENIQYADRMFEAAKQTYIDYQHSHNPSTPANQFDYFFANCGADYFVLDMRGQRDMRVSESILGDEQLSRFTQWAESQDENRSGPIFVVSTVPMIHLKDFVSNILDWASIFGARDDVRDHWAHDMHLAELKNILDILFACSDRTGRPLVVLSGDVHIGGIFELSSSVQKYPNAKVFQVTSSAITFAALGPLKMSLLAKAVAHSGEIGQYNNNGIGYCFKNHFVFPQYNFALVRYKTDGEITTNIEIDLIGKSEDNRVKESKRIDLLNL